jgi:hypothetical protein
MIAVHLLSPEKVAEQLTPLGCTYVEDLDSGHQIWRTEWGFHFTVPTFGDDRWCPKTVLWEILADIERTRPAGK